MLWRIKLDDMTESDSEEGCFTSVRVLQAVRGRAHGYLVTEDVSDGGRCFQDREAGVSLLCLEKSQEANVIGTLWWREGGDEWPMDSTLSEKGVLVQGGGGGVEMCSDGFCLAFRRRSSG